MNFNQNRQICLARILKGHRPFHLGRICRDWDRTVLKYFKKIQTLVAISSQQSSLPPSLSNTIPILEEVTRGACSSLLLCFSLFVDWNSSSMSKSHQSESGGGGGGNGYYTVGTTATATVAGDDDTKPESVLLQHAFEMETQGTMPWSTGLCHCFDDPRNCMFKFYIPVNLLSWSLLIDLVVTGKYMQLYVQIYASKIAFLIITDWFVGHWYLLMFLFIYQ